VSVRLKSFAPLLLVLLLGAALRMYRVGELPPGLYRDEGFYGLDAAGILRGELALWFPANNGREGLFMYLLAASVALFGQTVFALRVTSAIIGIATLLAIYAAGRAMFSQRIGVLSAAIMAVTFWHVAISRVAYRAVTLPLLLCLTLALLFGALRTNDLRQRVIWSAAAGAAFGATFYTYTSGQFILPLMLLYLLSLFVGLRRDLFAKRGQQSWLRHRASVLAFSAGALITLLPFLIWLSGNSALYFARAGQVSILNPAVNDGDLPGTLLRSVIKAMGMFLWEGDRIWRHNLSQRPVFDGFLGLAFLIGTIVCVWRWLRSWQSRFGSAILGVEHNVAPQFVLLWLLVFLLPTVLAEDTPHFLRAIGALPAACIIAAVGMETALAWASRRGILSGLIIAPLRRLVNPPAAVAAVLIVLAAVNTVTDYFNDYVKRDAVAYWLEAQNVALAHAVNDASKAGASVWVDARLANDNAALTYLAGGRYASVGADALPAAPAMPLTIVLDGNHDWSAFRTALPAGSRIAASEGPLAQGDKDPQPRRAFIVLQAEAVGADGSVTQRFEQGIVLHQRRVLTNPAAPNQRIVMLVWQCDTPLSEDYAVFVHWMRDGRVITQHDGSPALGLLPTDTWRPGDQIVDMHVLAAPGGAQLADELRIGLYRRDGNMRLRALDANGAPGADYVSVPLQ
jgi:4-amino-4-deoxy-L-arabinose transferase-like glycosyltransferase